MDLVFGVVVIIAIAAIGAGIQIVNGIVAQGKANKAKTDADNLKDDITRLENNRQPIINPYENSEDLSSMLSNPYANLGVATQAAEMQAEEADISLANTLDTLIATGTGAGGATALAQAAARSKQGISADIQKQEANNERLRAQGEATLQQQIMSERIRMQGLDAAGKQFMFQQQEARELAQLDRAQALYDNQLAQQLQYQANATAAFTGAATGLTNVAASMASQPGIRDSRPSF